MIPHRLSWFKIVLTVLLIGLKHRDSNYLITNVNICVCLCIKLTFPQHIHFVGICSLLSLNLEISVSLLIVRCLLLTIYAIL